MIAGAENVVFDASLALALPVAVAAGLVSFASPCVLPLVPGYLAYVSGMGDPQTTSTRRLVAGAVLFVAGFTVVFVLVGATAGALGGLLLRYDRILQVVAGVVAIALGVVFAGLVPALQVERRIRWRPAAGLVGAPLLGAAFGIGWVPCIGPTLGAVLVLATQEASAGRGALLAVAYCLGLGLPFVVVAAAYGRGLSVLRPLRRYRLAITRSGGAMLMLVGVLLVTGAWNTLIRLVQGEISGFVPVI